MKDVDSEDARGSRSRAVFLEGCIDQSLKALALMHKAERVEKESPRMKGQLYDREVQCKS